MCNFLGKGLAAVALAVATRLYADSNNPISTYRKPYQYASSLLRAHTAAEVVSITTAAVSVRTHRTFISCTQRALKTHFLTYIID